jgi:cobalt-zinc-cadmium efflux system membrane fusion protein
MDKPTTTAPREETAEESVPSDLLPAASPDGPLPVTRGKKWRSILGLACVLLVLIFFLAFIAGVPLPGRASAPHEETAPAPPPLGVHRVKDTPHTLLVPEDVRLALGILKGGKDRVVAVQPPNLATMRPLVLSGTTDLDPTGVMRIRVLFTPAKVSEIGKVADPSRRTRTGETVFRPLRDGDWVKKGDVLAVFNSEVVGRMKHDLIDALVALRIDEKLWKNAENSAAIAEAALLKYRQAVEMDRNAADKALNTLQHWGIPKEDLDAIYKEAERTRKRGDKRDPAKLQQWSRVELKAPEDGVILEFNVSEHETVQDPTVSLFQIAKVDRLRVRANAPEDDLPALLKLPSDLRRWTVRPLAQEQSLEGPIDDIGYLIDINQHNAVVKGHIDNPIGKDGLPILRSGQYVSCTIRLPPPENVVEVPMTAIVDDGRQCVVFVQPDADKPIFTMRRVEVVKRFEKTAFVRSELTAQEQEHTQEDKDFELLPRRPLRPGERVLVTGVLELKRELEDRESKLEQE